MSKTIESPVKEFPGTVILPDYLTMPQALAFEKALRDSFALSAKVEEGEEVVTQAEFDAIAIPAICTCVEKWELEGFEQLLPDTFPFSPRTESSQLIDWLLLEIRKFLI